MKSVKFPEVSNDPFGSVSPRQIFYPEVTDLYDKKNLPRVVYCIHALRYPSSLLSFFM